MTAHELTGVIRSQPANRMLGWTTLICGNLLLALCVFAFVRRLGGSYDRPLTAGVLVALAVVAVTVPAVFRVVWHRLDCHRPQTWRRFARLAAPSLAVILLGLAVSLPGSPAWALAVLWGGIALGEGISWALSFRSGAVASPSTSTAEGSAAARPPQQACLLDEEPEMPAGVSQQITRRQGADGESVYGLLRCEFAAGERLQNLHLAFCPPLAQKPSLNAWQVAGPQVTIKAAQIETFGARLELRLAARASGGESVVIEFQASAAASSTDAAELAR